MKHLLHPLLPLAICICARAGAPPAASIPPFFPDSRRFTVAIQKESDSPALPAGQVTGITVPHHMPAADLIARGFRTVSQGDYRRIIILFPDHFLQSRHTACLPDHGFKSALGDIPLDQAAASALAEKLPDIIGTSELFANDHGLQILLPFVAHHFPGVPILPVSLHLSRREAHWNALVDALAPLVCDHTLIVQSTDYSHYLSWAQAWQHDQQTLNVLATGDPDALRWLRQPANLDSSAAQFIHNALQYRVHGARPEAIENRNSQEIFRWSGAPTTSYIVLIYRRPGAALTPVPPAPGQEVWFFAGDTSLGRHLAPAMRRPEIRENLREHILDITGGAPLILNLEGVMLQPGDAMPMPSSPAITMDAQLTIDWLKSLNVAAVSLANNHSHDAGQAAYQRMKDLLEAGGIRALGHIETHDFGKFQLLALNDIHSHHHPRTPCLTASDWDALAPPPPLRPSIAFLHWGREGTSAITEIQHAIMRRLHDSGHSIIVGAHSHVASTRPFPLAAGRFIAVPSMGNFIFDQPLPERTGSLIEMRVFAQGTCFLRVCQLGNLYQQITRGEFNPEQTVLFLQAKPAE